MAHTIKKERDAFHDAKRQAAEMKIFKELRKIRNFARETYLISRKNRAELSNQRKVLDGLEKTIKEIAEPATVDANIASMELEPIPEQEELDGEATVLENYLDDDDEDRNLSDISLVIDEEPQDNDVIEELYAGVPDPDSSVLMDKIVPLRPNQELIRQRRLGIEDEVMKAGFHGLPNEGWNFKNYVDLQDRIQAGFSPVTISAPSKPDVFRKRYGKDWLPTMKLHADFGGTRGKGPRIQKPLGWKDRIAKEKAELEEVQEIKIEAVEEQPPKKATKLSKNGGKGKKNKVPTKAQVKFYVEDNPADNAKIDEIFDDSSDMEDFQVERSPVKLRSQEKLRAAKRKAEEPIEGTSMKAKKAKHVNSLKGKTISQHIAKWKIIPQ